jgi:hypothetical protein
VQTADTLEKDLGKPMIWIASRRREQRSQRSKDVLIVCSAACNDFHHIPFCAKSMSFNNIEWLKKEKKTKGHG